MNIIKRELRSHLRSLLIWCGSIIALIAIMMSEYEAFYDNPEMSTVLDAMPKALMVAFSMAGANLTTLSGFVSMASVYFYIMLGIFAVIIGSSIISKEERDKTAEFFLTLPVSRERVLFGKLIAAIINCILVNAVTAASLIVCAARYKPDHEFFSFMGLLMLALFILQLIFLSVGMFLAAILKRYKQSGYYSIAILFGAYIISITIGLTDKVDFLKYATPFKYFEAQYLLNHGELEVKYLIISAVIIAAGLFGTFYIYPKRDLHI
ncbi:MAG: ABC transporter permease subunit [Spirochaetales bacterium]|nr:ABC transporter permease subunit [Spirochaetales bacterium]